MPFGAGAGVDVQPLVPLACLGVGVVFEAAVMEEPEVFGAEDDVAYVVVVVVVRVSFEGGDGPVGEVGEAGVAQVVLGSEANSCE